MSRWTFRLPDLGEGLARAEIVAWHVTPGDKVVADQPLVAVETDKAIVEIPAPRPGTVGAIHAAIGEVVAVGAPLVDIGEAEGAESSAVVGELPTAEAPSTPVAASAPHPPAAVAPARRRVRASPAARRRARDLGIDIEDIAPRDGAVVQVSDVEAVSTAVRGQPLRGVRRAMAERMADAHRRVVPATVTDEADVSGWATDERPMPRLVRAVAAACGAEPRLNAWFDDRAMAVEGCRAVDLGIAVETEDGLIVPVLRDVAARPADELADALEQLKRAARSRRVGPDDLRGPTITLSNFGALSGLHAALVVVPPQVAIVGAGRMFDRAAAAVGSATRVLPLSVTFDHRVVTGGDACRFLAALVADLEGGC